ncbi:MAG: 30S ribosomal protein S9 [Candidatus Aminicenantes bacterium RBG_13_62_12]|nr:MAG: 30S ribosomal protein S9 [Candidatus Aminicenantes bacterium RBG_13_62_12]
MSLIQYYGTGKRKTSIARVFLRSGKGDITLFVNQRSRPFQEYFSLESQRNIIKTPLRLTETDDKFDIFLRVSGGGVMGQAEAVRLGISRALVEFNRELKPTLKSAGLLTRDARIKERKKYGLLGARKAPQYHKR